MLPRKVLEVNIVYLTAIRNGVFETGGRGSNACVRNGKSGTAPTPTGSGYSGRRLRAKPQEKENSHPRRGPSTGSGRARMRHPNPIRI